MHLPQLVEGGCKVADEVAGPTRARRRTGRGAGWMDLRRQASLQEEAGHLLRVLREVASEGTRDLNSELSIVLALVGVRRQGWACPLALSSRLLRCS